MSTPTPSTSVSTPDRLSRPWHDRPRPVAVAAPPGDLRERVVLGHRDACGMMLNELARTSRRVGLTIDESDDLSQFRDLHARCRRLLRRIRRLRRRGR